MPQGMVPASGEKVAGGTIIGAVAVDTDEVIIALIENTETLNESALTLATKAHCREMRVTALKVLAGLDALESELPR